MSGFTFEEISAALRLEGGVLIWKTGRKAGTPVLKLSASGYTVVDFKKKRLLAHRVVWLLKYGSWPEGMIDHKDRCKTNNDPGNLRLATNSQNQQNRAPLMQREFKGVSQVKATGRFRATINADHIGTFDAEEDAARAYDAEALKRYGEFAYLNFPDSVSPDGLGGCARCGAPGPRSLSADGQKIHRRCRTAEERSVFRTDQEVKWYGPGHRTQAAQLARRAAITQSQEKPPLRSRPLTADDFPPHLD